MKLLRIEGEGLQLYKGKLEIDFYASQRVSEYDKERLTNAFSNIYLNNAIAVLGVNASGKTCLLRLISLISDILHGDKINSSDDRYILGEAKKTHFNIYFLTNRDTIGKLSITIGSYIDDFSSLLQYEITDEKYYEKSIKKVITKKSMFEFTDDEIIQEREDTSIYIQDDVSIFFSVLKANNDSLLWFNLTPFTDNNKLTVVNDTIAKEIVQFLDPSIKELSVTGSLDSNTKIYKLKFNVGEELILYGIQELNDFLSSGTIKGISAYSQAVNILRHGGYLIVDELENHFNQEIASTLVRLFLDQKLNRHGATIIFSTHYANILDEFDRSDNIFITRKQKKLTVEKMSKILKRNDIKKSEVYQSGYLEGTTPSYSAFNRLRKYIISRTRDE